MGDFRVDFFFSFPCFARKIPYLAEQGILDKPAGNFPRPSGDMEARRWGAVTMMAHFIHAKARAEPRLKRRLALLSRLLAGEGTPLSLSLLTLADV